MVAPETSIGANNTGMILGFFFWFVCLLINATWGSLDQKGSFSALFLLVTKKL